MVMAQCHTIQAHKGYFAQEKIDVHRKNQQSGPLPSETYRYVFCAYGRSSITAIVQLVHYEG